MRMSDHEINDYELLKERLLKRFQLTEGGYRKKFKRSHMEKGETPEQFVERLRRFMRKWREMAGYDKSYEGLEEMVIRDQFFLTCGKSLQTFLKEKGKLKLSEMTKAAECYIEAHSNSVIEDKSFKGVKNKTQNRGTSDLHTHRVGDNRHPCGNCGLNNHSMTQCKKKVEPSNEDHQRVVMVVNKGIRPEIVDSDLVRILRGLQQCS